MISERASTSDDQTFPVAIASNGFNGDTSSQTRNPSLGGVQYRLTSNIDQLLHMPLDQ